MRISVCTTNYNCGHVLERHLESVYMQLGARDFEYIVVDNRSQDGSPAILGSWARSHSNMTVLTKRCTMGEGRQIAFLQSVGEYILVLDTDVIYSDYLRSVVDAYFVRCPKISLQSLFCGIFPRDHWVRAGGRRSLNTNEDVDMWLRLCGVASMRWYPIATGENVKEPAAWGRSDHMSPRYSRRERLVRLLRREWDLWKTREVERTDLETLIQSHLIDLEVGPNPGRWPQNRAPHHLMQQFLEFSRELRRVLTTV